jgi:hypothetical protein
MVTIKIQGGLGNQLFTYAHGYTVAKMKNEELVLDLADYSNGYFRNYNLDKFLLDNHLVKDYYYRNNKFGRLLSRLKLRLKYNFLKEVDCFKYQNINYIDKHNLYLYGYWQNEKYFIKYANEIREQFQIKTMSSDVIEFKERLAPNSIAVHIRRGDYLNNNWSINTNYYFEALKFFENNIDNPEFFFFSDDMEWVMKTFGTKKQYHFIKFENDTEGLKDFIAMSSCYHNIIANSTFSWWAAWLNSNSNKVVIAPKMKQWSGDYYPKEWIQIEA